MGPDALCFCDGCVSWDRGDDISHADRLPLALLAVYPSYEWVPGEASTRSAANDALEQAVHQYLQRLGRLPRPLSAAMCHEHLELLGDHGFGSIARLSGSSLTRRLILQDIEAKAAQATVLMLLLCGHGGKAAELVLADGSSLTLEDVSLTLHASRFAGTVVCVLNTCHAEPSPTQPTAVAAGWNQELPFSWVIIYSCGPESQKPSHAAHLVRLLGRLAADKPSYAELQSRATQLWVETRDPGQSAALWRSTPTICMGSSRYRGQFLGPAKQE